MFFSLDETEGEQRWIIMMYENLQLCVRDAPQRPCITQPAITCCIQDVYTFNLTAFHHLQKAGEELFIMETSHLGAH